MKLFDRVDYIADAMDEQGLRTDGWAKWAALFFLGLLLTVAVLALPCAESEQQVDNSVSVLTDDVGRRFWDC